MPSCVLEMIKEITMREQQHRDPLLLLSGRSVGSNGTRFKRSLQRAKPRTATEKPAATYATPVIELLEVGEVTGPAVTEPVAELVLVVLGMVTEGSKRTSGSCGIN